jgi:hypothetical protein|tara:strand:+ start:123 stop:1721 length:1599 start_codon:yes stop_codon:yes gene_type:complete
MSILKKSVGEMRYEEHVKITPRGRESIGTGTYDIHQAIKEISNNFIVDETFVDRYNRIVKGQIIIDTTNLKLYVIDDMTGWDDTKMTKAMDMGISLPTPAVMSHYGVGLKFLIPYFGKLDEIRTSRDGKKYYSMMPTDSSEFCKHGVFDSNEPLKRYDVETQSWKDMEGVGSMVVIDLKRTFHFKDSRIPINLTQILEDSYKKFLDETLSLEVIWLKDNKVAFNKFCRKHKPLKSAERIVQNKVINPDTDKPYEHIDKAKSMGPDKWEIDEIYKCPKTGYIVELQIGFVPHPKNLKKHYDETKDPKYDPDNYKDNIYRYGGKFKGLTYCIEDVAISGGEFSMDRKEGIYGTINIVKGIKAVSTKNAIERTPEVDTFELELTEFLRSRKILVRSTAAALRIDENEMEAKLLEGLKESSKLRKFLDIDNCKFDNQYSGLTSGVPDIVPIDKLTDKIKQIQEIKKEGGRDLWKALFQGMSYCKELDIKDLVIIAQDEELPSDIQIKVDIWNAKGWNIRYEQYQTLVSESVFPKDK